MFSKIGTLMQYPSSCMMFHRASWPWGFKCVAWYLTACQRASSIIKSHWRTLELPLMPLVPTLHQTYAAILTLLILLKSWWVLKCPRPWAQESLMLFAEECLTVSYLPSSPLTPAMLRENASNYWYLKWTPTPKIDPIFIKNKSIHFLEITSLADRISGSAHAVLPLRGRSILILVASVP